MEEADKGGVHSLVHKLTQSKRLQISRRLNENQTKNEGCVLIVPFLF